MPWWWSVEIKRLRNEHKWSQQELADRSGLTVGKISRFERGTVLGVDDAYNIFEAFGITPNDFFASRPKEDQKN